MGYNGKYKYGEEHVNFKHCGRQRHRKEYTAWRNMIIRCYYPKCRGYSNYGGRGISVCSKWKNDFLAFLSDIGEAPTKLHSIERIDNNGNYEPYNVVWATKSTQMENRRNNRWIEYNGEKMIMSNWAKKFNIETTNLLKMIKKYPFSYIYEYYKIGNSGNMAKVI